MISRRGVAKKRRKQEPGVRTAKCSTTVATTQQSWRRGNHFQCLSRRQPLAFSDWKIAECHCCLTTHNLKAIIRMIAPLFRVHAGIGEHQPPPNHARWDDTNSRPQTLRSPGGDHADNCKLQRLTSNVFEGGSRHFCAAGTFCARFRHATTKPRTQRVRAVVKRPPQPSLISLYRTMPYAIYRRQFDCCRKCADALRHKSNCCLTRHNSAPASRKSAARSSSRGPVWLSSSSARVRSHASRLARAHHQDSQDSVVVVCSP